MGLLSSSLLLSLHYYHCLLFAVYYSVFPISTWVSSSLLLSLHLYHYFYSYLLRLLFGISFFFTRVFFLHFCFLYTCITTLTLIYYVYYSVFPIFTWVCSSSLLLFFTLLSFFSLLSTVFNIQSFLFSHGFAF